MLDYRNSCGAKSVRFQRANIQPAMYPVKCRTDTGKKEAFGQLLHVELDYFYKYLHNWNLKRKNHRSDFSIDIFGSLHRT